MKRFFLSWAPALVVMALIFTLSSLPGEEVPLPAFPLADKGAHFLAYATMGFFLFSRRLLRSRLASGAPVHPGPTPRLRWPSETVTGFTVGVLFALSDEWHQRWVPNREPDPLDLVADGLGLVAGFWVAKWVGKWASRFSGTWVAKAVGS